MHSVLPPFSLSYASEFPVLLASLNSSQLLGIYQAGKVVLVRSDGQRTPEILNSHNPIHQHTISTPGVAYQRGETQIHSLDKLDSGKWSYLNFKESL